MENVKLILIFMIRGSLLRVFLAHPVSGNIPRDFAGYLWRYNHSFEMVPFSFFFRTGFRIRIISTVCTKSLIQTINLNVVAVRPVTICSIRQILVIRHFRFGTHKVVGWVTHCPSPSEWRHITIDPEHVEPAIWLYLVHSILSMRECCLNISAALSLIEEEKIKTAEARNL